MSIRFGRSGNGYTSSEVMETADDDWRNITDLAERRRIQNRLAQRNYRRKLRQRLEELERQAGEAGVEKPSNKRAKHAPSSLASAPASTISASTSTSRSVRSVPYAPPSLTAKDPPRTSDGERSECSVGRTVPLDVPDFMMNFVPDDEIKEILRGDFGAAATAAPAPTPEPNRDYCRGDFGPLFSTLDVRSQRPPTRNISPGSASVNGSSPPGSDADAMRAISPHSSLPELTRARTNSSSPTPPSPKMWQPNDPRNFQASSYLYELPSLEYPTPSPLYSASPLINPNPYHLNPPMPRDEFYLTMPYHKFMAATMALGRILKIDESTICDDDVVSNFNKPGAWYVPAECEDLQPTPAQLQKEHHPYIDVIPFRGFRDRLIDVTKKCDELNDWEEETRLCRGMGEGWSVWGECPWESRSWEIGEEFAREFWYLLDAEMIRTSNFWRRQRGLKPLTKPAYVRNPFLKKSSTSSSSSPPPPSSSSHALSSASLGQWDLGTQKQKQMNMEMQREAQKEVQKGGGAGRFEYGEYWGADAMDVGVAVALAVEEMGMGMGAGGMGEFGEFAGGPWGLGSGMEEVGRERGRVVGELA